MDWKCGDLLLGGDMEEFTVEKTVKADKVSLSHEKVLFLSIFLYMCMMCVTSDLHNANFSCCRDLSLISLYRLQVSLYM